MAVFLTDPCNNFTFAPWTTLNAPTVTASGHVGNGFSMTNSVNAKITYNIPAPNQTNKLTLGVWLYIPSAAVSGAVQSVFAFLSDAGATEHFRLGIDNSGFMQLLRGTTSQVFATGQPIYNAWNQFEFAVLLSDTVGTYSVKLNGTTIAALTFSGDTKNGGTKTVFDQVAFYAPGGPGVTAAWLIDDITLDDGTTGFTGTGTGAVTFAGSGTATAALSFTGTGTGAFAFAGAGTATAVTVAGATGTGAISFAGSGTAAANAAAGTGAVTFAGSGTARIGLYGTGGIVLRGVGDRDGVRSRHRRDRVRRLRRHRRRPPPRRVRATGMVMAAARPVGRASRIVVGRYGPQAHVPVGRPRDRAVHAPRPASPDRRHRRARHRRGRGPQRAAPVPGPRRRLDRNAFRDRGHGQLHRRRLPGDTRASGAVVHRDPRRSPGPTSPTSRGGSSPTPKRSPPGTWASPAGSGR